MGSVYRACAPISSYRVYRRSSVKPIDIYRNSFRPDLRFYFELDTLLYFTLLYFTLLYFTLLYFTILALRAESAFAKTG